MKNLNLPEGYQKPTLKEKIKTFRFRDWLKYYVIYFVFLAIIHFQVKTRFNFDTTKYFTFVFFATILIHIMILSWFKYKGLTRYWALFMWGVLMLRIIVETFIKEYPILNLISWGFLGFILIVYIIFSLKRK